MKGSALHPSKRPRHRTRPPRHGSPPKLAFQDPVGRALPPSLRQFRWNVDKVERKLQEKIQEKTQIAGNFVYQQAYRLLECTRGQGIDFVSFKEQIRVKFGIILEDAELQLLFDKYDEDRNGTIDMHEFIRRVLPPDYHYGQQWFEKSQAAGEAKHAAMQREARHEFLLGMGMLGKEVEAVDNTGQVRDWTLQDLLRQIQTKVVQKTPSGDDQYRRAFKMLRCGRDQGIRMQDLRNNLKNKFGIFVSETQMKELFAQFDVDGSGDIDLHEFLQFVEPAAYPGDSRVPQGLWTKEADDEVDEEDDQGADEQEDPRCEDSSKTAQHAEMRPKSSRKERPQSADPKKTARLRKQRDELDALVHGVARLRPEDPASASSSSPPMATASASPPTSPQRAMRRHTTSMVDIHKGIDGKSTDDDQDRDARRCLRSCATSSSLRPRSAGSGISRTSSTSSVRAAAYMKRPSTPQTLRQKCLESRLAIEAARRLYRLVKQRAAIACQMDPEDPGLNNEDVEDQANEQVDEEYAVPHVTRTHAMQRDPRPYSPEGKVLQRSKVTSAPCRS